MFNKIFSFFFINSKINSLLLETANQQFAMEALIAKSIYKKQIRRYLGLGFILSFLQDTDPFKARINLLSVIEKGEEESQNPIIRSPFHIFVRTFIDMMTAVKNDFTESLLEKKELQWGINRFNPFFIF